MSVVKSLKVWVLLLLISLAFHGLVSREIGQNLQLLNNASSPVPVKVELNLEFNEQEEPKKDPLIFDDPLEIQSPDVLLPTQSKVLPPLGVNLAVVAQAGANSKFSMSVPIDDINVFVNKGAGIANYGTGVGMGLTKSTNSFVAYVQGLRATGLDVVFVVDATGSMDWVIKEVLSRIVDIVDVTRSLVSISRFGIVAYRDFNDPDFVTIIQPLTFSVKKLILFLEQLKASGGGDLQEAVSPAIDAAYDDSGWRVGAKRIMILIGDAAPHDRNLSHILKVSRNFSADGGQISTLDVSDASNPATLEAILGKKVNRALYRDHSMFQFQEIAEAGQGVAATLDGQVSITRQLISLIMGGDFDREMSMLMENL